MYMYTDIRAECMLEIERAYAVNLNTTRTCTVLGDLDQRCATRMSELCHVALASMCTDFMPCSVMLWAMHSLCNIHCYVNALPDFLWRASKVDVMLKRLDDDMKETKSPQARRQMKKRCWS